MKMCGCESCAEFCGSSDDQSGLCGGDADVVGGHGVGGGEAGGVLGELVVGLWDVWSQLHLIELILLEWMVVAWLFLSWRQWKAVMEELEVRWSPVELVLELWLALLVRMWRQQLV